MKFLPYDKPHFLEPAHDHDPADVSNLTNLPPLILGFLPDEVRELIPAVQEATSIVFASFNRLDELLSQRLDRLTILPKENGKLGAADVQYSEPAYFWYQNQVKTEIGYLIREALPDWKHKAARIENECIRQGIQLDPDVARTGAQVGFAKWLSSLRDEVQEWKRVAEAVEVPDFDQAVADLMAARQGRRMVIVEKTVPSVELDGERIRKIGKVDSGIEF